MQLPRPTARRWWHPTATCFVVIWVALLWAGREKMLRDPGTFWHTVVGERILQTGKLIRTDPFSFTFSGKPWIAQQWLGECLMALVHRVAGLDGLLLATAAVLAWTFAFLAGRLLRAGVSWPATALITVLALAAASYHFHPRPHVVTIALTAWTLGLLNDIEAGRRGPRRLFVLPVLFAVWTNIHGGVLGSIGTTLVVLFVWLAVRRGRHRGERGDVNGGGRYGIAPSGQPGAGTLILVSVAVLSVIAVLVNPYGLDLPRVWVGLMTSDVLPQLMIEHAPLELSSIEGAMIGLLAVLYIGLLANTCRHSRARRSSETGETPVRLCVTWFVPLIWLGLAVMRVRHGPLFAVTATLAIAEMLPHSSIPKWFAARGSQLFSGPRLDAPRLSVVSAAAVPVVIALTLQAASVPCPIVGAGWARLDTDYWPVTAIDALKHPPDPAATGHRMFNDMRFGGYVIYHLPEYRVFIDDRCELYGDAFLTRYAEIQRQPELIEPTANDYGIGVALVTTGTRLDHYLSESPAWRLLHGSRAASLYGRAAR